MTAATLPAPPQIEIGDVSKGFRRARDGAAVAALAGFTLDVAPGSFVTIVGPSGCGKTTLLRLVNGLMAPDSGSVLVNGVPPRPGPEIGFVFQSFRLLPWASVADNVAFGLSVRGASRAELRERSGDLLRMVGLSGFAQAYPSELSGGMKQRVALARALATDPEILLMDEPFASIDAQTREMMQTELLRIWSLRRSAVLFVTHSVDEAVLLADRCVLVSPRPGHVAEVIDVDLPRPRDAEAIRADKRFIELRAYLWNRLRTLIQAAGDPGQGAVSVPA